MITVIDYGVGNLFSLVSSLKSIGETVKVSGDYKDIKNAEKLILPGVGAFCDAQKKLVDSGLFELVKERAKSGTYIMGICLGMQMLFDKSFEYGEYDGLSLIGGNVLPIKDALPKGVNLNIPHIGWNALDFGDTTHPLFKYIKNGDYVYFVHSYYAKVKDKKDLLATCEYGTTITATVGKDNVLGCQFHPEKSGEVGLNILRGFCDLKF